MDIAPISIDPPISRSRKLVPPSADILPTGQPSDKPADARSEASSLAILRQEIRAALKASFRLRFVAAPPAFAQAAPSAEDAGADALNAARQIVAESPSSSAAALIRLRRKVEESASIVRQTTGPRDDSDDIDDALARVDGGLRAIENDASRNVESSASVLNIEQRSRQRSTINIRTQEGDIVKLDVRRFDRLSASDAFVSADGVVASQTEVAVSSRSRLVMRVDGDLNEQEFAAIQNVLRQAEGIADEFFSGDLGDAFNLAAGLQFDTEQLANVRMGFRSRQVTSVSYAELLQRRPEPAATIQPVPNPVTVDGPAAPIQPLPAPAENPAIGESVDEPAATIQPVPNVATDDAEDGDALAAADVTSMERFFDMLSDFLRSIGDGYEPKESGAIRFHYSESFKLSLLKTVIGVTAPDDRADAADSAAELIDVVVDED
ncbi:MAG: hypothetical protein QNJ00_13725 [Woeseiaceae bacterium]|nr:hypothetical protein [Woeseiaceae bacterium]